MVNLNPHDPRDDLPERELAGQSRSRHRATQESDWQTYVIGGAVAVLALIGLIWISSTETPNQQSAENQPALERPADRTQPEVPAAPPAP
jgi:hypothetical protein